MDLSPLACSMHVAWNMVAVGEFRSWMLGMRAELIGIKQRPSSLTCSCSPMESLIYFSMCHAFLILREALVESAIAASQILPNSNVPWRPRLENKSDYSSVLI